MQIPTTPLDSVKLFVRSLLTDDRGRIVGVKDGFPVIKWVRGGEHIAMW